MCSNKFIKSVRFAHPTGKSLRALPAAYESRYASLEVTTSMGIFSKIFGKAPPQSQPVALSVERAVDIIRAYGGFLEIHAPTPGCVADASKLPFPKAEISQAIVIGLKTTTDARMREMLKGSYLELANWQEGVGPADRGIDTSKLIGLDPEAQAKAILSQAEGMDEWNNMVSAEMALRKAQLEEKGLW